MQVSNDPKHNHICCNVIRGHLLYIEKKYGRTQLDAFLNTLGMEYAPLTDKNNWIPWQDYLQLLECSPGFFNDPELIAKSAEHSITHNTYGGVWFMVFRKAISIKHVLGFAVPNFHHLVHAATWELIDISRNSATLKVQWNDGIKGTKDVCHHRQEIVASVPLAWGEPKADYVELEHNNQENCCIEKYTWQYKPRYLISYITGVAALIFAASTLVLSDIETLHALLILVIVFLTGYIIDLTRHSRYEKDLSDSQQRELEASTEALENKFDELSSAHKELNNTYNELYKARKLEPLGVLAGSIAHDYNNLLTAVVGYLDLTKLSVMEEDDEELILDNLNRIERAANMARNLTQRLLVFSQAGAPITELSAIDILLRESVNFALTGTRVTAEYSIEADLWSTNIDQTQFNQVFGNLAINAYHAMPHGGTLEVSAQNIANGEARFKNGSAPLQQDYVLISFQDHGIGIAAENIDKVFDPYFTTKSSGSGLGLASVRNILRSHGGDITVSSTENKGTRFELWVPADKSAAPLAHTAAATNTVKGCGRVLAMEDDPRICNVLAAMLKHLGYEADIVQEPDSAARMYQIAMKSGRPYRIILLDLVVPGISGGGLKAIQEISTIDKSVKAIITSGFSADPVMSEYRQYGFSAALRKPYNMLELSLVLHKTITGN